MSAAKKGLGRGFDSLIPTDLFDETFDPTAQEDGQVSELREISVEDIHPNPDQPRRLFDEDAIDELAESIREHGILQPIIVVRSNQGYIIVAGERRFRASKKAGLKKVPVIIRSLNDQNQLEVSLIENIQRRDLNTIETATAYAKLRDQFNMTIEQISKRVHKSPSAVTNTMRLLKLPKEVVVTIAEGRLTEGQARPLIGQSDDTVVQLVPRIINEDWSARKVEQYVVNLKKAAEDLASKNGSEKELGKKNLAAIYESEIKNFGEKLNAKVAIQTNTKGAGKVVIPFKDAEDFERLKKLLLP